MAGRGEPAGADRRRYCCGVGGRRWARGVGAACTFVLAVAVAATVREVVVLIRWVIEAPTDDDLWWGVVPALGGVLAVLVVARSATTASTADAYVYGIQRGTLDSRGALPRWVALLCGVGVGVPLGYEGPMVYFGGVVGVTGGPPLGTTRRSAGIACATAAVAMVITAPVAAAFFTSEVVRRGWPHRRDRAALATGAGAAWLVLRFFDDHGGVVGTAPRVSNGAVAMGAIVIGGTCGLVGRGVAAAIVRAEQRRLRPRMKVAIVATALLVSVPAGRAASGHWIFVGSGARLLAWAVGAPFVWIAVAALAFVLLVVAMVAGGVVGGLFLPLVSLGGAVALVLTRSWLSGVPVPVAVAAGGSAMLAAGYGAPLAATALAVSTLGLGSASSSAILAVVVSTLVADGATVSLHRR